MRFLKQCLQALLTDTFSLPGPTHCLTAFLVVPTDRETQCLEQAIGEIRDETSCVISMIINCLVCLYSSTVIQSYLYFWKKVKKVGHENNNSYYLTNLRLLLTFRGQKRCFSFYLTKFKL